MVLSVTATGRHGKRESVPVNARDGRVKRCVLACRTEWVDASFSALMAGILIAGCSVVPSSLLGGDVILMEVANHSPLAGPPHGRCAR